MLNVTEKIGLILSQLAQWLGIKPTEENRLQQMEEKLTLAKADNIDMLDSIKDEIRVLESRALNKKVEYNKAGRETRRIITGEIERIFRELDRLGNREKIISSNIEKISVAQAKLNELRASKAQGVDETQLDDIAIDLQSAFDELKVTDRSKRDLELIEYEPFEENRIDIETRIAESRDNNKVPLELPKEMQERFNELAGEGG